MPEQAHCDFGRGAPRGRKCPEIVITPASSAARRPFPHDPLKARPESFRSVRLARAGGQNVLTAILATALQAPTLVEHLLQLRIDLDRQALPGLLLLKV